MPASGRRISGSIAVVTGASRGIGAAVAFRLAEAGARVLLTSRNAGGCSEVISRIQDAGGEASGTVADLADSTSAARVMEEAVRRWGPPSILVNNAGTLKPHFVHRISDAELDQLMAVNFRGTFSFCMAAYEHMRHTGGSIVNISALSATRAQSGMGAYAASKAAMLSMTRTMAREWGPLGIRVNAVVPGAVATEMIMPKEEEARQTFLAEMGSKVALGRIAYPDDLSGPVLFLAGPESAYVTGQSLFVDGGAFE